MMLRQISIFLENQSGYLSQVCRALGDAEIDILTLSLADTQQFGILRLIVADPEIARTKLEASGYTVRVTDVVAVGIEDRPGGLADLLTMLDAHQLNIEYMYAFSYRSGGLALMIFRFDDPLTATNVLIDAGTRVLCDAEVVALIRKETE